MALFLSLCEGSRSIYGDPQAQSQTLTPKAEQLPSFSPLTARNVFSKELPVMRFLTFVRTNADPLPGFTCKNSRILQGLPELRAATTTTTSCGEVESRPTTHRVERRNAVVAATIHWGRQQATPEEQKKKRKRKLPTCSYGGVSGLSVSHTPQSHRRESRRQTRRGRGRAWLEHQ